MENTQIQKKPVDILKGMLSQENVKKRFEEIMGSKAPSFISSIITVVNGNEQLQKCSPNSIIGAAIIASSLDLSIVPAFGHSSIVPFGTNATFQIQKRGFLQLAQRSGQFLTINVTHVFDGEITSNNRFTGEIQFDSAKKKSDKIVGYYAYFKLINGFEKGKYMTVEEIEKHAKKYSQSYRNNKGLWADKDGWNAMAEKTVLKLLLANYAPLSIDMKLQTAVTRDAAVNKVSDVYSETIDVEAPEYIDNPAESIAPEKSELDILTDKIITHIDVNKNKTNEEIRANCLKMKQDGKWNVEEAMNVCTLLNIDVL